MTVTCEVFVDGTRLADDADSWEQATPTALAGLNITWGRSGPQDQPDVGSCSLTVADKNGDTDFLGLLHVGRLIDVYAVGELVSGGPTDVAVDGGFATPLNMRVQAAGGTVTDDPNADATSPPGHAVRLEIGPDLTANGTLTIPPAPFTTAPGGWLTIPTVAPDEEWTASLMVRSGPVRFESLSWEVTAFDSSLASSGSQYAAQGKISGAENGYVTISDTFTIPAAYPVDTYWLGITIRNVTPCYWSAAPAAQTWDTTPAGSWDDTKRLWVDNFRLIAPAVSDIRSHVFAGRITDMTASAYGGEAVQVEITASEWTAELANQNVGDVPWNAERLDVRAMHIADLVDARPMLYIDPRLAPYIISWRDVDAQPAYGLLQELAVSGDGVLWAIGLDALWFEDPQTRQSAGSLSQDGSGNITIVGPRSGYGAVVSSCDITRDPLQLVQTVEDLITRVDITWQEQTLDDGGQPAPTERTLTVKDTTAAGDYGNRKLGISTQLTTAQDATDYANRVLVRFREGAWHTNGVTWDTNIPKAFTVTEETAVMELLDMARRVGLLLTITDTPAWVPLGPNLSAYVEGGSYTYEGGRWILELSLSPSTYSGDSAAWADIPTAYQWQQFDDSIIWWDMWGVAGSAKGRLDA